MTRRRLRSPSLFWTFAGAFLMVLIVAALLQGLVIVTVVEPIAGRWLAARAELVTRQVARELETALAAAPDADVAAILGAQAPPPRVRLFFHARDGRVIPGPGPRPGPPPPRHGGLRPPFEGGVARPPGAPPGPHLGPGGRRPRILSRQPVVVGGETVGEVVALTRPHPLPFWPIATPRPLLLFLPIAVVLAGAAGLVMLRLLLRRLRALESLATRVTEGDLTARIEHPRGDEIGRLADRFNRMTESLAAAKRRIEESDRRRRRLLADITHELATPLTSIRGYAETLQNPAVELPEDERARCLRDVLAESERMDLLIQDLLELTRLEAGANQLVPVRLDWTALCRNTVQRFEARFSDAGVAIGWRGPVEEAWIVADGHRLEQVLENLLVNALRYVPAGGSVTLSLAPAPAGTAATGARPGPTPGRFRLEVRDDGPGFPPADLPLVFDRFYRAEASRTTAGSGLGLAIVQEIVRQHGGTVRADNGSPRGAVILVELPAADDDPTGGRR